MICGQGSAVARHVALTAILAMAACTVDRFDAAKMALKLSA